MHGWLPKLSFRYFNMNMNNAYLFYKCLHNKHNEGRRKLTMKEAIQEAAHACLQKGEAMRKRTAQHPSPHRNLMNVFDTTFRNIRSDAKGVVVNGGKKLLVGSIARQQSKKKRTMEKNQKHYPWYHHQSTTHTFRKECRYKLCPGLNRTNNKRAKPFESPMRCEECSINENCHMHFCNTTKKGVPITCHMNFHMMKHHNRTPNK